MKRKSSRLSQMKLVVALLGAAGSLAGCSVNTPCADYDRVRGIVIKGRGAEPSPHQSSPDSLALTPVGGDGSTSQ